MYEQLVARYYIAGHFWMEKSIPKYTPVHEVRAPRRGLRPGMGIDDVLPDELLVVHIWRFFFRREEGRSYSSIYLRYDLDMDSVHENEDRLVRKLVEITKERDALDKSLSKQQKRYGKLQENYMELEKQLEDLKAQCIGAGYRLMGLGMGAGESEPGTTIKISPTPACYGGF